MMDIKQSLVFGKLAIGKNLLSKESLKSYLQMQEQQQLPLPLLLLRANVADEKTILELIEQYLQEIQGTEQQDPGEDLVLVQLLLKKKLLMTATLLELWNEIKPGGAVTMVGLLLKKQQLPVATLLELYSSLNQETLGCPGCEKEFRLLKLSPGKKLRCKHCKTVFQVPTIEHAIEIYESQNESLSGVQGDQVLLEDEVPSEIGDYQIIEKIAQGEMGIICRGRNKKTGEVVAVKILREAHRSSQEAKERFKREALTVKQKLAKHPNIVTVFDVGIEKEIPYFTMEFIEGKPLADLIAQGPIPIEYAVATLIKLCEGIGYAHKKGIVHRDIKPSNILFDSDNEPRIADFGLAKCLDSNTMVTRSGSLLGTPYYMSPEQAKGQLGLVGPRSDIYALGVVFYEMLTGHNPFQGKDTVEIYQNILTLNPQPPSKMVSAIPKTVDNICLKCLRKNPFQRYKTADDLISDLRAFLEGKDRWWYRLWQKIWH